MKIYLCERMADNFKIEIIYIYHLNAGNYMIIFKPVCNIFYLFSYIVVFTLC